MIYFSGLPNYWMYESSGKLADAISTYLDYRTKATKTAPNENQIALIREYLKQWINAPAYFEAEGCEVEKAQLRKSVEAIATVEDINQWLNKAIGIGIDPL